MMKLCSKCGIEKSYDEFHKEKKRKDGLQSVCKSCHLEMVKKWSSLPENKEKLRKKNEIWRRNNIHRVWAQNTITSHRHSGYQVDLDLNYLTELAKSITTCRLCGEKLSWSYKNKSKVKRNSPTLDRINNEQILNNDNVEIICYRCNIVKNSYTVKNFLEYFKNVVEHNGFQVTELRTKKSNNA